MIANFDLFWESCGNFSSSPDFGNQTQPVEGECPDCYIQKTLSRQNLTNGKSRRCLEEVSHFWTVLQVAPHLWCSKYFWIRVFRALYTAFCMLRLQKLASHLKSHQTLVMVRFAVFRSGRYRLVDVFLAKICNIDHMAILSGEHVRIDEFRRENRRNSWLWFGSVLFPSCGPSRRGSAE